MKNKLLLAGFILIFFGYYGCQKNENTTTGNPFVSLAVTGSSSNATIAAFEQHRFIDLVLPSAMAYAPPASLLDAAGNAVVIQSIWISISEIEFKLEETAASSEIDGSDTEFSGPYSVDLLSASPAPIAAGYVSLSQLRRLKVKLARVGPPPSGAPAGFLTKSIYIAGMVNGQNFSYSTQDENVIEISGPQLVTAVENSTLLLELQTANLIRKINLSAISSTTDIDDSNRVSAVSPCAGIDASATDLFSCFKKGFETESNLGRDDDNDFSLDSNEDSVK